MAVAVLDIGKTNIKLFATTPGGAVLEQVSTPNRVLEGPPYRHHDLAGIERWALEGLASLNRLHPIEAIVACAHGSGGVLVDDAGAAMPMIDYEQAAPAAVTAEYLGIVGSYRERASAIMHGASHLARQMLWIEREWPEAFARARSFLATPQYWAFRFSGVAAGEVTSLAAQSHLWSSADGRPAALVARRGWERLMPPMRRAYETLGTIRPEIARATGLAPTTRVICGIHDSSANFYRYQAAGLADLTVVSTGTWIVALTDRAGVDFNVERPGRTCNADVAGRPIPGMLTMGGREFAAVAGETAAAATEAALARLVARRSMALPTFGSDDGLFPGTARRGHILGPEPEDATERTTLAVLYTALLTVELLEDLPPAQTVVLDGGFVRDPLYGRVIAALLPGARVLVNRDLYGTATGAALLAGHERRTGPAPLDATVARPVDLGELARYRADWRDRSRTMEMSS